MLWNRFDPCFTPQPTVIRKGNKQQKTKKHYIFVKTAKNYCKTRDIMVKYYGVHHTVVSVLTNV